MLKLKKIEEDPPTNENEKVFSKKSKENISPYVY